MNCGRQMTYDELYNKCVKLEQQKAELEQLLVASRRANNSLKASYNYNRLEKLEQQNKELKENEQHYKKAYLEELALKSRLNSRTGS